MSPKPSRSRNPSARSAPRPWRKQQPEFLNIGKVSRRWLFEAGIRRLADLRTCGAARAYRLIRDYEPDATLDLLWALEGAIQGVSWRQVTPKRKAELRKAVEAADREAKRAKPRPEAGPEAPGS